MKTKHYVWLFIICIFSIGLWFLFRQCSVCFKDGTKDSHLNTAYVAAGALFSAFAVIGSGWMFFYQHKTELKKTSLNTYTTIYSGMTNDPKFNYAFEYLLSHINRKTKIVFKKKTIGQLKNENTNCIKKKV